MLGSYQLITDMPTLNISIEVEGNSHLLAPKSEVNILSALLRGEPVLIAILLRHLPKERSLNEGAAHPCSTNLVHVVIRLAARTGERLPLTLAGHPTMSLHVKLFRQVIDPLEGIEFEGNWSEGIILAEVEAAHDLLVVTEQTHERQLGEDHVLVYEHEVSRFVAQGLSNNVVPTAVNVGPDACSDVLGVTPSDTMGHERTKGHEAERRDVAVGGNANRDMCLVRVGKLR